MSQALPPDLVHPSIPVLREASENDVDFTSAEELHRFWKGELRRHTWLAFADDL